MNRARAKITTIPAGTSKLRSNNLRNKSLQNDDNINTTSSPDSDNVESPPNQQTKSSTSTKTSSKTLFHFNHSLKRKSMLERNEHMKELIQESLSKPRYLPLLLF